jgi:hypothetical protein
MRDVFSTTSKCALVALAILGLSSGVKAGTGCGYFAKVTLGGTQGSWSANCHVYQYVEAPGISWERANSIASLMQLGGKSGYLATLTSQEEIDFAESVIPGGAAGTANVYVGGARVWNTTAKWRWETGPEQGTVFWDGRNVGRFAPWDPIYALGGPATPDNPKTPFLFLNAWFRPYFTASFGAAMKQDIYAGANSGFLVEFSR